jgi:hypothetical protein
MLSSTWLVRRSFENSHHQTAVLYTLNAPRHVNSRSEDTLKLHRNDHVQHVTMIRGLTGSPVFRASLSDGQPTKPRTNFADYLPPRFSPSSDIWQRGRFESQREAPAVAAPKRKATLWAYWLLLRAQRPRATSTRPPSSTGGPVPSLPPKPGNETWRIAPSPTPAPLNAQPEGRCMGTWWIATTRCVRGERSGVRRSVKRGRRSGRGE